MKKALIKDVLEFREWQSVTCIEMDESGQRALLSVPVPNEYPVIVCWNITAFIDFEAKGFETVDKFDHCYIYLGNFPVKNIKHGTYVYQVFQTGDVCDV